VPRDLVVGNGSLQVMFDAHYLRGVYLPNLGKGNHTVGHPCRFGVFVDGRLSWADGPEWERRISYEPDTLVTDVSLTHRGLGLRLHVHDAVDFHEHDPFRRVTDDFERAPGNPWIPCTLWLAQYRIRAARSRAAPGPGHPRMDRPPRSPLRLVAGAAGSARAGNTPSRVEALSTLATQCGRHAGAVSDGKSPPGTGMGGGHPLRRALG